MSTKLTTFPGESKSRVTRAGQHVRDGKAIFEDYRVIEAWRAAHRAVLNTFQASLRKRTRNKRIVVAQRHKRRNTIFNKLNRYPKMELARMDDIAGFRLIFESIKELKIFRDNFHKAKFNHKRKNEKEKYDYIKFPKETGYRGIHDVYSYDVNSVTGKQYKGLLVEIQYRTLVQHAWATAVEVIGFITSSQPKFQRGDRRYEQCMVMASEILARHYEKCTGTLAGLSNLDLLQQFSSLNDELHLIRTLTGLNIAETVATSKRNTILIFKSDGELEIQSFREEPEALRELFKLENEHPELDVVLVKADTNEEIRMAFKNYFSDAKDFIHLLTEAQDNLSRTTENPL